MVDPPDQRRVVTPDGELQGSDLSRLKVEKQRLQLGGKV